MSAGAIVQVICGPLSLNWGSLTTTCQSSSTVYTSGEPLCAESPPAATAATRTANAGAPHAGPKRCRTFLLLVFIVTSWFERTGLKGYRDVRHCRGASVSSQDVNSKSSRKPEIRTFGEESLPSN